MAEDEHDQSTWIGGLMDAAARGYQPDGERLRELVASRIAQDDEARGLGRVRARGRRNGVGARTRLGRTFSAGAGIAAVAGAVAIAVGVTTALAVTSSGPTTRGSGVGAGIVGAGTPGTHTTARTGAPPNTGSPSADASSASPAPSDAYVATGRIDQASNPNWAQLDVSVTAQKPLTALEITIQVPACPGLSKTGLFDTGAYGLFTASSATAPDGSVSYVFRLAAGHTFSPGTVEFAAQFNHGSTGWLPGADTYRISAQAAAEPDAAVTDGAY